MATPFIFFLRCAIFFLLINILLVKAAKLFSLYSVWTDTLSQKFLQDHGYEFRREICWKHFLLFKSKSFFIRKMWHNILKEGAMIPAKPLTFTGWRRGTKSDHEDDQMSDPPPLDRRESRSEMQVHRNIILAAVAQQPAAGGAGRGRMSFKAASQATLSFLSARKRIEDGIKTLGKKMTRKGSSDGKIAFTIIKIKLR